MSEVLLSGIYRHWIWIGPPLVLGAAVVLVLLIQGTVSMVRKSHLLRVLLMEVQEVRFKEAGPVALAIEAPMGSTRFAGVDFHLTSTGGEAVRGRRVLFRTRSSGISRVRLDVMQFELPWPGAYLLHMRGLGPAQERDAAHAVVFRKPIRTQAILRVAGMVGASVVLVASLVFFILRVNSAGPGS
jgi:hypothetical protein